MINIKKEHKKISAVILSFHRPENIYIILENLEKIGIIDEVIVWHSNPKIKIEIPEKFTKATLVSTSRDYGLNVRWHASSLARNEVIFMQDDDWLLSEKAIRRLYHYWLSNPRIIHSMWNKLGGQIYSPVDGKSGGKTEIILTNALMFHKKYATGLLQVLPQLDRKIIEITKRNGEDILFSYYVMSQSRERNVAHDLSDEVHGLSHDNAICMRPGFRYQRDGVIGYCLRYFAPTRVIKRRVQYNKFSFAYESLDEQIGKIGIILKNRYPRTYYWIKKYIIKDGLKNIFGIRDFVLSFKKNKKNIGVVSIHRIDRYNTGDKYSNPTRYFKFLKDAESIDMKGQWDDTVLSKIKESVVILGGGGLIGNDQYDYTDPKNIHPVGYEYFKKYIDAIQKVKPKKIIAWGLGHNIHGSIDIQMPKYLKEFDLVGVRDYGVEYSWVPCASCMSPLFDKKYKVKNKVVVYEHQSIKYPINIDYLPKMTNRETDIEKVIEFLGSADTILTNSYHGAYWGILLNKKVVIVNPFSSKFYGFKYKVPITDEAGWQKAISEAVAYPEALKECRKANINFANEVRKIL